MHHRLGLSLILPEQIELALPIADRILRPVAEETADFAFDELVAKLPSRNAQLWFILDGEAIIGAFITQLRPYAKGKFCEVVLLKTEGREVWLFASRLLEQWAVSEGCNKMKHEGRKGFERIVRHEGYRVSHVVYEKDL